MVSKSDIHAFIEMMDSGVDPMEHGMPEGDFVERMAGVYALWCRQWAKRLEDVLDGPTEDALKLSIELEKEIEALSPGALKIALSAALTGLAVVIHEAGL